MYVYVDTETLIKIYNVLINHICHNRFIHCDRVIHTWVVVGGANAKLNFDLSIEKILYNILHARSHVINGNIAHNWKNKERKKLVMNSWIVELIAFVLFLIKLFKETRLFFPFIPSHVYSVYRISAATVN